MNKTAENIDDFPLLEIVQILWKKKLLIFLSVLFCSSIALFYAFTEEEVFTTSTIFITKTKNNTKSNLTNLASLAGLSISSSVDTDPSDYLDKVIQDQYFLSNILNRKWFYKNDSLLLDKIWGLKKDTSKENWEYKYEKLKLNYIRKNGILNIIKDKKTGILTLTVNMPDPKLAYEMNVFTLNDLSNYIRNSIQSQIKEKRYFIEKRIQEVKCNLEASENALALFKERNIMSTSPKVVLEEIRLNRNVTLNQELYIQLQKQYELALIEEKDDQALIQIIKNPEIPLQRSKPDRKKILLIGTILGLMAGGVFVYIFKPLN